MIRCIEPITKGYEITMSYCQCDKDPYDRRDYLLKHFAFKCKCRICSNIKNENTMNIKEINNLYEKIGEVGYNNINKAYNLSIK